jgi:hypothetical protein
VLLMPLIELRAHNGGSAIYVVSKNFLTSSLDSITVSTKVSYIIGHKYDQARLG